MGPTTPVFGVPQHEDLSHVHSSASPSSYPWDHIGNNSFHFIGLDAGGAIVLRQKLSCGQV
ncbi:hypothetical protein ACFQY9_34640 [Microvirga aerilata]|uniref:hypothetical protein n=1 Tax=Microvirga aerilata TaxID=670292 RepID=UPI003634E40B